MNRQDAKPPTTETPTLTPEERERMTTQTPIACRNRPAPPPGAPRGPCEPGIHGRPNDCVWCHRTLPDCEAPYAAGPCMPRNADGRCIWCERELAPGWPGIKTHDGIDRSDPCPGRSAYPGAPCIEAIGRPRTCLHCARPMPFSYAHDMAEALSAAPPTEVELDQWFRDASEWANEKHTGTLGESWTSARRTYSLIVEVRRLRARLAEPLKLVSSLVQLAIGGAGAPPVWETPRRQTVEVGLRGWETPRRQTVEVGLRGYTLRTASGERLPLPGSFLSIVKAHAENQTDIHAATALLLIDEIERLKAAVPPAAADRAGDFDVRKKCSAPDPTSQPPRESFSMTPVQIDTTKDTEEKETPLLRQRNNPPFFWTNDRPPTNQELEKWEATANEHMATLHRDYCAYDAQDGSVMATDTIERLSGFTISAVIEIKRLRAMVQQLTEAAEERSYEQNTRD